MKKRSFLTLLMFVLAAGSAIATEVLSDPVGFSSKTLEVPIQAQECQARKECPGGPDPCMIAVDHDGNGATPTRNVTLYDGNSTQQLVCGVQLFEP